MILKRSTKRTSAKLLAVAGVFVVAAISSYFTFLAPQADAATPYMDPLVPFSIDVGEQDFTPAVTHDSDNNVYVAVNTNNVSASKILKYSNAGVLQASFNPQVCDGYTGSYAPTIRDVTVGQDNYLYTTTLLGAFSPDASCIQKYDTSGVFIAQIGTLGHAEGVTLDKLTVGGGHVFANDPLTQKIYVLDSTDGTVVTQFGSSGSGDGQFNPIYDIAYYNNQIYVNDGLNKRIQVLELNGDYVRQFSTHIQNEGGSVERLAIDTTGDVYVVNRPAGKILRYGNNGTLEVNYRTPFLLSDLAPRMVDTVTVDSNGIIYALQSGLSDKNMLYRYDTINLNKPQYAPAAISATNIGETTASLSWGADSREPHLGAINDSQFRIVTQGGVTVLSGSAYLPLLGGQFDATGLYPGTTYTLYVSAVNLDGVGPEAAYNFTTTGTAPLPISLDPENRTLTITGDDLLGDGVDYSTALQRSLVTLNGNSLKACSTGIGMTAQELVDAFSGSYPNIGQLVTDDPPCYLLFNSPTEVALTDNQVIILLPEGFDFTARGSVSIDGRDEVTFNDNVNPSIRVNGNNPASGVLELPKRLSFSGMATPLAKVTVTVHSDPVSCETTANTQGNWSCMLGVDLAAGIHTVYLTVVNPDNSVEQLGPYTIRVDDEAVAVTPGQLQKNGLSTVTLTTARVAQVPVEEKNDDSNEAVSQKIDTPNPGEAPHNDAIQEGESKQQDETNNWLWILWAGLAVAFVIMLIFILRRKKSQNS